MWEESQTENSRLRLEMASIRQDLDSAKSQLETAIQVKSGKTFAIQASLKEKTEEIPYIVDCT